MHKLSLALLLTLSFPASAMQETTEKALQYTVATAGSLVAGYVASCALYGKDETDESLQNARHVITDKRARTETALRVKDVASEIIPDTCKQLAVVGATAAGGIGMYRALATAMHHMSRTQ
jgi:hypothetical protein